MTVLNASGITRVMFDVDFYSHCWGFQKKSEHLPRNRRKFLLHFRVVAKRGPSSDWTMIGNGPLRHSQSDHIRLSFAITNIVFCFMQFSFSVIYFHFHLKSINYYQEFELIGNLVSDEMQSLIKRLCCLFEDFKKEQTMALL